MTSNEPAPDQPSGLPSYGSTPASDGGSTPPPPPPGAPGGYGNAPGGAKSNPLAITSLVLGIVSLVIGLCCGFVALLGIAAIITGVVSRKQIAASGGAQKGNGLAIGGIVTGILALIFLVVYVILLATGAIDVNFRGNLN